MLKGVFVAKEKRNTTCMHAIKNSIYINNKTSVTIAFGCMISLIVSNARVSALHVNIVDRCNVSR